MKTEYYFRLNSDTDLKMIEALEEIGSTKKFPTANAMLKRCVEKGLPLLYAEVFSYATSSRGKEKQLFDDSAKTIKNLEREVLNLIINTEILERLTAGSFNMLKSLVKALDADESQIMKLPDSLKRIKNLAMKGFNDDGAEGN